MSSPLQRWLKFPTLGQRLRGKGLREDLVLAVEQSAFGRSVEDELPGLQAHLLADEQVVRLIDARRERADGILGLTTKRLVFAPRRATTMLAIERSELVTITAGWHRGLGTLVVRTADGELHFDRILGNQADSFVADAVDRTERVHRDPLEELGELRALRRAGVIGDAEFELRKRRLVDDI